MDFLMPFGVGGIWLAYFLWQLQRRPLVPLHDPNWNTPPSCTAKTWKRSPERLG